MAGKHRATPKHRAPRFLRAEDLLGLFGVLIMLVMLVTQCDVAT